MTTQEITEFESKFGVKLEFTENDLANEKEYDAFMAEFKQNNPMFQILQQAMPDTSSSVSPGGWKYVIYWIAVGMRSECISKKDAVESVIKHTRNLPELRWSIIKSRIAHSMMKTAFEDVGDMAGVMAEILGAS